MLFALIGSSGSGKTTVGETVFGKENEIVSFTTRNKREQEIDGVDYHFMTLDEFNHALDTNELIEYSEYSGNFYGITKEELESKTNKGIGYVVIDYNGYTQLKNILKGDVTGVFVDVDRQTVYERLVNREETKDFIEKRMSLFDEEQLLKDKVDFVLDNNSSLESTIDNFNKFILELWLRELLKF